MTRPRPLTVLDNLIDLSSGDETGRAARAKSSPMSDPHGERPFVLGWSVPGCAARASRQVGRPSLPRLLGWTARGHGHDVAVRRALRVAGIAAAIVLALAGVGYRVLGGSS
jgi:hypothetical protein